MANFYITGFILNMAKISFVQHNTFIKNANQATKKELQKASTNELKELPETIIGKDLVHSIEQPKFAKNFNTNYHKVINKLLNKHLEKLDLTKNLSKANQQDLLNHLEGDKASFCAFTLGDKPSILLNGKFEYLKSTEKYDIVRRKIKSVTPKKTFVFDNTFILDKEKTKNTISENMDFYRQRLDLKKDASTKEIYEVLTGKNSPLLSNDKHDIIGITLGYSPINSILFHLEQTTPHAPENRNNLNIYKKQLLNQLHSKDSPYHNFNQKFTTAIANSIRNIHSNTPKSEFTPYGYSYINLLDDDKHNQKIVRSILKTYKSAKSLLNG